MKKSIAFVWPPESYGPTSLFKHFTYLGESAEYARRYGDVKVVDLSVEHPTRYEITKRFANTNVVFMPVEAYTARRAVKLSRLLKQSSPAEVIAYGTLSSMNPGILAEHFDAVISGDSFERAIDKFFLDRDSFDGDTHGGIYSRIDPLPGGEWAFPALDLLPLDEYFKISPNQLELRVQRGCRNACTFCAEKYRIPGGKVFHRTPQRVAQFLSEQSPELNFYLDAATFTQDKKWTLDTCGELELLSPKRRWRTITRVDCLDEETINALSRAGCYKIGFGVETLNANTQRTIRKVVNQEDVARVSRKMKDSGITPRAFFILGLPGQTRADIDYAQEFSSKLGIEFRWKEYVPIQNALNVSSVEECEQFERDCLIEHSIPGINREEYRKLLSIER